MTFSLLIQALILCLGLFVALLLGLFTSLIVLALMAFALINLVDKSNARWEKKAKKIQTEGESAILDRIQAFDEHFSADEFKLYAYQSLLQLNAALVERNEYSLPQALDCRFGGSEQLLETYRRHQWSYTAENIELQDVQFSRLNQRQKKRREKTPTYLYLTVQVKLRLTEYVKDAKGQVLLGNPSESIDKTIELTFYRNDKTTTDVPLAQTMAQCPHCQETVPHVLMQTCPHCKTRPTLAAESWQLLDDGLFSGLIPTEQA